VLASQAGRAVETARLVSELAESKLRLEATTDSLLQAERLAAIGRLAAAVAHQIRNPLTIISATAELMIERLGPEHALSAELERLAGKVSDTEAIVRDLMQLGKPLTVRLSRAPIAERLKNVAMFMKAKAEGQGVRLVLAPSPAIESAWMDPAQLERCLLDLCLNSLQSMEGGGTLELGCAPHGEGLAEIWVQDDGKGLAGVDPAQLFEPFISRRLGGTGLGLYNVQRVCQAMGARIHGHERVDGKGARFVILVERGDLAPSPIQSA
jgi:signal transduction histidine kinase